MFEMVMAVHDHVAELLFVLIAGMKRMRAIFNSEVIKLTADPRYMGHVDDLKTEIG